MNPEEIKKLVHYGLDNLPYVVETDDNSECQPIKQHLIKFHKREISDMGTYPFKQITMLHIITLHDLTEALDKLDSIPVDINPLRLTAQSLMDWQADIHSRHAIINKLSTFPFGILYFINVNGCMCSDINKLAKIIESGCRAMCCCMGINSGRANAKDIENRLYDSMFVKQYSDDSDTWRLLFGEFGAR